MNRGFFSIVLSLFVFLSLGACGGHGGGNTGDDTINLIGKAFFPANLIASKTAVPNSPFVVVDFVKAADKQTVAQGVTDNEGSYDVTIVQSKVVAVIVSGQTTGGAVRVSGLISADPNDGEKLGLIGKDFDGITDVACEAGVTAIVTGSVAAQDFDSTRIANLELAAALVEQDVNHLDPASVTAGATRVRDLTDDGAHPPA